MARLGYEASVELAYFGSAVAVFRESYARGSDVNIVFPSSADSLKAGEEILDCGYSHRCPTRPVLLALEDVGHPVTVRVQLLETALGAVVPVAPAEHDGGESPRE